MIWGEPGDQQYIFIWKGWLKPSLNIKCKRFWITEDHCPTAANIIMNVNTEFATGHKFGPCFHSREQRSLLWLQHWSHVSGLADWVVVPLFKEGYQRASASDTGITSCSCPCKSYSGVLEWRVHQIGVKEALWVSSRLWNSWPAQSS